MCWEYIKRSWLISAFWAPRIIRFQHRRLYLEWEEKNAKRETKEQ